MRVSRVAILLALLAPACSGTPDPDLVYIEDFESLCDGTPCGWVQSGGPDDAARYAETVPGDHGLELLGDDVFVRGPVPDALSRARFADRIAVRMSARCDFGSSLEVRVTIEEPAPVMRVMTFGKEVVPEDAWTNPLPDATLDPLEASPGPWQIQRVLGVSVLKRGAGSCEIDYLAIRAVDVSGE